MAKLQVIFHNETKKRVLAQIFAGRDSFSSLFVEPKTTETLSAEFQPYDIYFKDAVSGWEVGHKRGSSDTTITLRSVKGHYVVIGDQNDANV